MIMYQNSNHSKLNSPRSWRILSCVIPLLAAPFISFAQEDEDEDVFELSPFEVAVDEDIGYLATSSLAGTRLRTDLSDIGSAVSVYTPEFLEDIAAVDNETLLSYALSTEVGGSRGNFINSNSFGIENDNIESPNNNTRVRGLTRADSTVNYYLTDVPWDGYTVERVDIQRGANSVLFGLGSPAGIINATTISAQFRDKGKLVLRNDKFGSVRLQLDYNKVIIEDELAVRIALLYDNQEFRQDPAFEDDRRGFFAFNYTPKALNNGGTLFTIKGSFERGDVESNRPRYIAPIDRITPFVASSGNGFGGDFANMDMPAAALGGRLVDQVYENGIQTSGTPLNNAWIAQTFAGITPFMYFGPDSADPLYISEKFVNSRGGWYYDERALGYDDEFAGETPMAVVNNGDWTDYSRNNRIGINGEIQRHIRGTMNFAINGKNRAAANMGLPFQGFWKDSSFTDTTYFDFYNNLLDGNTKIEKKDWDQFQIELTNTFFNNKIGYNIGYYNQSYESEFNATIGNVFVPSITVDIGKWDASHTPGKPVNNPWAGMAYVAADNNGGRKSLSERESARLQVFASHDFTDLGDDLLYKLFGQHDLVGVAQKRERDQEGQSYTLTGVGTDFILARGEDPELPSNPLPPDTSKAALLAQDFGNPVPDQRYYLGSSNGLMGLYAVNSGLSNLPHGMVTIRGFDATPLPGFDAVTAAEDTWTDPWTRGEDDDLLPGTSAQSRNPDNYVGWNDSHGTYNFYNALESEADREYLTNGRSFRSTEVESKAIVWTGRWFEGAVVGMYGWREDEATETWLDHDYRNWRAQSPGKSTGSEISHEFTASRKQEVQSRNWSIKANVSQITGLSKNMPFEFHVLYSEGEVQTPDPSRVDVFGRTLDNALGNTEDMSFMLISKDKKYSLRVTNYETASLNAVSSSNVNREKWRLQQILQQGAFRAGLIETGAQNYTASWLTLSPEAAAEGYASEAEWHTDVVAPGWRQFEAGLWERFPLSRNWYLSEFQPGDRTPPQVLFPDGATLVEDQFSKGWEFEFTANPTPNWNISISASKTKAIRDNVPGAEFAEVVDYIGESMRGPAGLINMWWFAGPNINTWLDPFLGELVTAQALNGSNQPEIREWRGQLVTNYNFRDGRFKGLGIGGAFRYEDSAIFAYEPIDLGGGALDIDLDTSYADDVRHTYDFWVSYSKKLTDSVDWKIQLSVFNAFGENELVPLARNPDGTFGHMGIREGQSWAVTNTFTF